jgi:amidohydrolase
VILPGASVAAADEHGAAEARDAEVARLVAELEDEIVTWRRDLHEHPELGNREFRTAGIVADHLRSLGFDEVRTEVAHTGVVGVLKGGEPGAVVALRADMDALPVTEETGLPFASKARATYNGQEVGVMHACGHDAHTSMLMGAASVLAAMRGKIPGTVVFIFQPAEEGPPAGERGGAKLMIEEGALADPVPEAIFGLHVLPYPSGTVSVRPGAMMAGASRFQILVRGTQTHGAAPWFGVDPIVAASQIVLGLQTIVSRQANLVSAPVVISVGRIEGGVRHNVIPDEVEMEGTVRVFDPAVREEIFEQIERKAAMIAESAGATATVRFPRTIPVTYNDPVLTERMTPTLKRVVGDEAVMSLPPKTVAEDFSYFQQAIPGMYFFLGINASGVESGEAAMNHSPRFFVNEEALPIGVRSLATLALDYLHGN